MSSTSGTFIYCVGYAEPLHSDSQPYSTPGIGELGDRVRTVEYADLAAVVSDSGKTRYEISRENLTAYQRVLEEAMTRSDVLPVAFGTVAGSDQEVQEKLLKRELDELHHYLAYVRGRIELELKVLWNREALFAEIVAENDEIRALRDSIADRPPDATYHERIHLGELIAAAIDLKSEQEAESILESLRPLVADTRLNKNLNEMMILNASFLVDRTEEQAFSREIQALSEAKAQRLIFRYGGPLPPHNFVNLNVSWEDELDGSDL
jgi:hypothetical protein